MGQQVWVQSARPDAHDSPVQAVVETLGTRIVEYPDRLKKNPRFAAWGREAMIRLPENSPLLLGEKVTVSMRSPEQKSALMASVFGLLLGGVDTALAASSEVLPTLLPVASPQPANIKSLIEGMDSADIEPSGIISEASHGNYLVISDEMLDEQAQLLRMNRAGQILSAKRVLGKQAIDDIESISRAGDAIYIAASLSFNKHGERKEKRCQFMQLREEAAGYVPTAGINLCAVVEQLAKTANDKTRLFLSTASTNKTIDVEAHAIRDNKLYLGFKAPLDAKGNSVILVIEDLAGLLKGAKPKGNIWRRISLKDVAGDAAAHLSDMVFQQDELLLLGISSAQDKPVSHLWRMDAEGKRLTRLKTVPGLRAEGISDLPIDEQHMFVFDAGGEKQPKYLAVDLSGQGEVK